MMRTSPRAIQNAAIGYGTEGTALDSPTKGFSDVFSIEAAPQQNQQQESLPPNSNRNAAQGDMSP